jgi:nucleoside phosphorylase
MKFSSDEDGYLRRECPSCICQFKWIGSIGLPQDQMFFCPYCGVESAGSTWWTPEQLTYIREVSAAEMQAQFSRSIQEGLRGSRYLKYKPAAIKQDRPGPPEEANDLEPKEFSCHPEAKIKVDDPERAKFCLICGSGTGQETTPGGATDSLPFDKSGGGMHQQWRLQIEVLSYLSRAADGDIAGFDDKQVSGSQLLQRLESLSLKPNRQKLRSQLDFLFQKGLIHMVALPGAGIDVLECFCEIQASGYDVSEAWERTEGRALRLLETLHRAGRNEIPEVRTYQDRIFNSNELSGVMEATASDYPALLQYLEGKGLIETSKANGGIVLSITLSSYAIDRVERLTLRSLSSSSPEAPKKPPQPIPTIGILTALPKEFAAVQLMLTEKVAWNPKGPAQGISYFVGRIGHHTVVVALAPDMGNNAAAASATAVVHEFPKVEHLIMCGIAGGVPKPGDPEHDVRLGDIVVSNRNGVVQYDNIKQTAKWIEHRHPPRPPAAKLLGAVRSLQAGEEMHQYPWVVHLELGAGLKNGKRPADNLDARGNPIVYPPDPERSDNLPRIFHATIAAANTLLKDPVHRDYLGKTFGVKAVEMEGSGVADATWASETGYLVVRGIVDYCDGEKGDYWHGAAAIAAAAYVKALIQSMPAVC